MIESVFISDLHLHPEQSDIQERLNQFILWAKKNAVKKLYILGDFFHAWPGDDAIDAWSAGIAEQISALVQQGVQVFYMHGNRDFLLGTRFARLAGWELLVEPTLIQLGSNQVLLAHGDRYCTYDKAHQRFRRLTRNRLFSSLFLCLPLKYRMKLVNTVRQMSQENQNRTIEQMDVAPDAVIADMRRLNVSTLIHGHTHKPGITSYHEASAVLKRYVLSDWDDIPILLCYDSTEGLCFNQYWF